MRFPCIGFRGKNGFLRRRGKGVEGDPAGRCSRHVPTKFRSRAGQQRPSLRSCRPAIRRGRSVEPVPVATPNCAAISADVLVVTHSTGSPAQPVTS